MQRARDTAHDLYKDVLCHPDVGPILQSYMHVESLLALRCTQREVAESIAFSGKHAKAERQMLTDKYVNHGKGPPVPGVLQAIMANFAGQGRLHMLQYMCIAPSPFAITPHTISKAAERGKMEILEWAQRVVPPIERGWRLGGTLGCECWSAVKAGRVDVLDWLLAHGYEMPNTWPNAVAESGRTHVLEWALKRGILVPERDCTNSRLMNNHTTWLAAHAGNLDTLKALRALEPPCAWDPRHILRTLTRALRQRATNECLPPYRSAVKASQYTEILEWMRDGECKFLRQPINNLLLDVASSLAGESVF